MAAVRESAIARRVSASANAILRRMDEIIFLPSVSSQRRLSWTRYSSAVSPYCRATRRESSRASSTQACNRSSARVACVQSRSASCTLRSTVCGSGVCHNSCSPLICFAPSHTHDRRYSWTLKYSSSKPDHLRLIFTSKATGHASQSLERYSTTYRERCKHRHRKSCFRCLYRKFLLQTWQTTSAG